MPNISEVPVLIVGGGAAGCVLSMELARRGVEYRCIERMPGPGRESRAIAMHARTIELLDLVDKELSRRILERDLWCKGYVMHFLRDGERTEVRPGLDYTTVDSRYNCILAQNLDLHLNGFPDWTDYFHYCVGTDHFLMVAPLPGGHFRLLLSDRGEAADPTITPQQAFMRLLERHFDGITMGDVVWHSRWETWVRLADTFRQGNVFLAGDAAHVHSTTGGQGMNCCMQDAFNLGWKLALVVKGYARPELLDTYEAERRPVAEQVIWAASSLHDIFMTHGKDIGQRTRTMFDPGYTEKVVNTCSGVAYTYRDYVQKSAAMKEITGQEIGERSPDIDFEQGGTLFDRLRHAYFTLLAMPDDANRSPVIERLQRRFSPVLAVETLPRSKALSKRYGPSDGRLILVRPDGYVAFKCCADEAPLLEATLESVVCSPVEQRALLVS